MLPLRTGPRRAAAGCRTTDGHLAVRLVLGLALALAAAPRGVALAQAQVGATVTLGTSRASAVANQPITLTATVWPAGPASGLPTGEVTFLDGGAPLGTAALDGGLASLTVGSLARGTHLITASYPGDPRFLPAAGALAGGLVVADTAPVAGAGQALALDGLTQHARAEDPGGALDAVRTVELWFEAAPGPGPEVACLVQQGEGDGLRFGLCLSAARDQLIVRRGFETTFIPVTIGAGWHHLALAAGPVDTLVYLDGAVFTPLLGALRARAGRPLLVGAAPAGDGAAERFAGRLDELRLWTTARTAGELETWARQPVAGDAAGLAGLWRMDEGAGGSLLDAAPAHLEAVLAPPGGATWTPSGAWRRRVVGAPRRLAPFLAGYDADGDPFTLAVVAPAQHGLASAGGDAASYEPDTEYAGPDAFTCEVAGAGGSSRYETEVEVPPPAACLVDATCSGGGACVAGACVSPARFTTVGGGFGCATAGQPGDAPSGAPGAGLALAGLALLARLPQRRRRGAATILAALLAAGPARAAEGFALRTVELAPAGDRFLAVPDAGVEGHLVPAAAFGVGWTERPLELRLDGLPVPGGTLVERQLALHLGLSLALWDRLRLEAAWPLDLLQLEQRPGGGVAPSGSTLEDPRLGARVLVAGDGALALAAGLSVWVPLGDAARFGSDGTVRLQPSLLASGRDGALAWAAEAGLLVRRSKTAVFTEVGPAATGRVALGWVVLDGRLQLGPELVARYQFSGATPLGLDILASARWTLAPGWSLAAALGSRHGAPAPGTPPVRALFQVAWRGEPPPRATPAPPVDAGAAAPLEPLAPAPLPEPALAAPPPDPEPPAEPPEPVVAAPPLAPIPAPPRPRPAPAVAPPGRPGPRPVQALPPAAIVGGRIRIEQRITFDQGTARLQPGSFPVLEAVARILLANPRISRVVVVGHTDVVGTREVNQALSLARAQAVRDQLVRRGVGAERLQVRGLGADRPIGDDRTEAGREANRRVEFVIATIGDR